MAHLGLITRTKPILLSAPASRTTAQTSGAVDMMGWDGVAFDVIVGAMTSTATLDAKIQESNASDFSTGDSAHDITGAALVQVADTGGSKVYRIEVWRPSRRYVRIVGTPATAAVVMAMMATLYEANGITMPPTKDTTVPQAVLVQAN